MNNTKEKKATKPDLEKGILYVATGLNYVNEAIISALSCKQHNNYPIALITDSADYELPENLFDIIIIQSAFYNYRDKLLIKHSPFEKTIFLDTDTYVVDLLADLFRILDYREFAIHQADEGFEFDLPEVSNAMPEFNTGVIAFRLTSNVKNLFESWSHSFDGIKSITTDQYHLRKTLYASEVKFAIFSSAYNFIIYHTNLVMQKVKILHGRPQSVLPIVAKDINRIRHEGGWRRAYFPYNNKFGMIYQNLQNDDIYKLLRFHTRALFGNYLRKIKKIKF